jgi:hypothetical protein
LEYRVYYGTAPGKYDASVDVEGETSKDIVLPFPQSCTYYATVVAINNGGSSLRSGESSKSDTTPPTKPTGLAASVAEAERQVVLSWDEIPECPDGFPDCDNCDLAGYDIWRQMEGEGYFIRINARLLPKGVSTYTDLGSDGLGLVGCKSYQYEIQAVDACGNGSTHSVSHMATPTDSQPPAPPTELSLTQSEGENTLAWTISADDGGGANDVVSYQVYCGESLLDDLPTGSTGFSTPVTCEEYKVSTVDNCGSEGAKVSTLGGEDPTPEEDTSGPNIFNIFQDPMPSDGNVPLGRPVTVCADISDPSDVSSVTLTVSVPGFENYMTLPMTIVGGNTITFIAEIPPHNFQQVSYSIRAVDTLSNETVSEALQYLQE